MHIIVVARSRLLPGGQMCPIAPSYQPMNYVDKAAQSQFNQVQTHSWTFRYPYYDGRSLVFECGVKAQSPFGSQTCSEALYMI